MGEAPASVEEYQRRARRLIGEGRLEEAQRTVLRVLEDHPENPGLLYTLAVIYRYRERHGEALETLEKLLRASPSYARAFQEIAYNHEALGKQKEAQQAFEKAVERDSALLSSWIKLRDIHAGNGEQANYEYARDKCRRLEALPRPLLSVASLINQQQYHKADLLCREFLRENPHHIDAMRMLAEIGVRLQVYDDAQFLLESVLTFNPGHLQARHEYAIVLRKRHRFNDALREVENLLNEDPENVAFRSLYASVLTSIGRHSEAIEQYRSLIAKTDIRHAYFLSLGHACKTLGRVDEAVDAYRAAYNEKSDFGDAYWSLANLKTYRFTDSEIEQAKRAEARISTAPTDRIQLCFALGKAKEDRGEYEASFQFYERGNRLRREQSSYSIQRNREEIELQIETFDSAFLQSARDGGCRDAAPIFIVGLPRAGSTLIEQILASHTCVDGTAELPTLITMAHKLNGRRRVSDPQRYPAVLKDMDADKLRALGEKYISETAVYRDGAPFFTDKMPNNFRHIGLIHMILPNARIIDARRDPVACSFSCYKQLFAEGQEFTYGLREQGDYYRSYVQLMEHWDRVLPGKVLRVNHEELIADLEGQVRRILEYCGLEFEEACVRFYETDRPVRTPSSEQVRQPVYDSGKDQWRHFSRYLEPLYKALGPLVEERYHDSTPTSESSVPA